MATAFRLSSYMIASRRQVALSGYAISPSIDRHEPSSYRSCSVTPACDREPAIAGFWSACSKYRL